MIPAHLPEYVPLATVSWTGSAFDHSSACRHTTNSMSCKVLQQHRFCVDNASCSTSGRNQLCGWMGVITLKVSASSSIAPHIQRQTWSQTGSRDSSAITGPSRIGFHAVDLWSHDGPAVAGSSTRNIYFLHMYLLEEPVLPVPLCAELIQCELIEHWCQRWCLRNAIQHTGATGHNEQEGQTLPGM